MKVLGIYTLLASTFWPDLAFGFEGEAFFTLGLNGITYPLLFLFTLKLPLEKKYKWMLYVALGIALPLAWTWTGNASYLENRIKISVIQILLPLTAWFSCLYLLKDKILPTKE